MSRRRRRLFVDILLLLVARCCTAVHCAVGVQTKQRQKQNQKEWSSAGDLGIIVRLYPAAAAAAATTFKSRRASSLFPPHSLPPSFLPSRTCGPGRWATLGSLVTHTLKRIPSHRIASHLNDRDRDTKQNQSLDTRNEDSTEFCLHFLQ